jgi:hypothetical protein
VVVKFAKNLPGYKSIEQFLDEEWELHGIFKTMVIYGNYIFFYEYEWEVVLFGEVKGSLNGVGPD